MDYTNKIEYEADNKRIYEIEYGFNIYSERYKYDFTTRVEHWIENIEILNFTNVETGNNLVDFLQLLSIEAQNKIYDDCREYVNIDEYI